MCDEIRRFFSLKRQDSGKEKNASKHRAGNNNNTLESKSNEIPHTQTHKNTMTKDLAAKQRDLYFQNLLAGENDEKEKNKASNKKMNKSDKLEKKKQLDEKRRIAREKMMKKSGGKGGASVLLGFGKRKSADEDETEETTITGIPGPPTDAKPLTRKELNRIRFFRVAFPLGVGGACGFARVSFLFFGCIYLCFSFLLIERVVCLIS